MTEVQFDQNQVSIASVCLSRVYVGAADTRGAPRETHFAIAVLTNNVFAFLEQNGGVQRRCI